ncbi:MAG TPA: STAS domain-containing protein [Pseudonocardiaceae bacterium]|jgi:anti-anti-sigma factor|nr:STAS domain-containing protein [Pseudonocardiaceae bacterium]
MAGRAHDPTELDGPTELTARAEERDGVMVVTLAGELDMSTEARAGDVLTNAVARGLPLVLDMTGLRFFSSAGLTLLARLDQNRRESSLDVRLAGDQRVVVLPLELTGMRNLFPIHSSLDEALAAAR